MSHVVTSDDLLDTYLLDLTSTQRVFRETIPPDHRGLCVRETRIKPSPLYMEIREMYFNIISNNITPFE